VANPVEPAEACRGLDLHVRQLDTQVHAVNKVTVA
jgi:hypothetical protein